MSTPVDRASSPGGLLDLVRPDLRGFGGYRSARTEDVRGDVWLNANEAAWANVADADDAARRYPEPQPVALRDALARLYGCASDQLLIGRGSDEAIDLLVRALCVPGRDAVVITPPVFGMYAVSARLQDARLVEVPLVDGDDGLAADTAAIGDAALAHGATLVFICSPSNPGGATVALDDIAALAQRLEGRALVVVDEAYGEFADQPSATTLTNSASSSGLPNVAVLRTLSKAHALAAARIGVVIADAALIAVLRACQAPYPVPAPCAELALAALSPDAIAATSARVAIVIAERARVSAALAAQPGVRRVYASQGNFVLVRFDDASRAFAALLDAGVVVRDQRAAPQLGDALRITIGTPVENDRMLAALRVLSPASDATSSSVGLPPDGEPAKVSA